MTLRKLTAAAMIAAAAVSLSACDTKVGAAAKVGDTTISDTDVTDYIVKGAPGQAGFNTRSAVLTQLIEEELFRRVLVANGGVPSNDDLDAVHDEAVATVGGSSVVGAEFDSQLTQQIAGYGVTSDFTERIVRTLELEYVIATRTNTTPDQVVPLVDKLNIPVTVRSRYGAWDATQLAVNPNLPAGVPSFIKIATVG